MKRGGYSVPCLDPVIPSRTCEFLFKTTPAIDSLPHSAVMWRKVIYASHIEPHIKQRGPSFSISDDPLPPNS